MSTNQTHTTDNSDLFIYGLTDPRTGELRYVGLTTRGMKRVNDHILYGGGNNGQLSHYTNWQKSLGKADVRPDWFVIEEHSNIEELSDAEDFWIQYFEMVGCSLVNGQSGGYNGRPTAATKKKMSESAKRHRKDPTYRAKLSKKMTGMKRDPEACKQMGDTLRGRPRTQKHLDSIAAFHSSRDTSEHYIPTYNPYNMTQEWANQIRDEYVPYTNGRYALAKKHGVSSGTVRNILNGKTWNK